MSLTIAGLRSSQSLARSALLIQVRYASSGPKKRTGTAQDVDRLLEEQRKQARMAPGMDPTRQGLILFQPIVEPKFSLPAYWDAGYKETIKYFWKRFMRWVGTKRSLGLVEKLDKSRGELSVPQRILQFFPRLINQYRARALLDDVFNQYIRFNEAQAKGNLALLRTAAQGNVLQAAERRIRERQSGDQLDWQLLRVVDKPKLLNAVSGQVTKEVYATQLVVAFDTEQSLTFKPKGRVAQVRSSRVKEYYVIQRLIPGFGPQWKLRDQIHETDPFADLKKAREAKRIEASKTKLIK